MYVYLTVVKAIDSPSNSKKTYLDDVEYFMDDSDYFNGIYKINYKDQDVYLEFNEFEVSRSTFPEVEVFEREKLYNLLKEAIQIQLKDNRNYVVILIYDTRYLPVIYKFRIRINIVLDIVKELESKPLITS